MRFSHQFTPRAAAFCSKSQRVVLKLVGGDDKAPQPSRRSWEQILSKGVKDKDRDQRTPLPIDIVVAVHFLQLTNISGFHLFKPAEDNWIGLLLAWLAP